MDSKEKFKQFNTLEIYAELNRRGYTTHPMVDLETINAAIKCAESERNVEVDIPENSKIWLANRILKDEEVLNLMQDILTKGIIDGWIDVDEREYSSWL